MNPVIKTQVDVIYVDFARLSIKVTHNALLLLKSFGIPGGLRHKLTCKADKAVFESTMRYLIYMYL